MKERYYLLWINPEPWAVGSVSVGKTGARISPNPNLAAFQNAVREALEGEEMLPWGAYSLTFFFWRQQAKYIDAADRVRQRNQADATNMQKGLEDALQGILFDNDRDVTDIRSVIVEQGTKVEPRIVIRARLGSSATTIQDLTEFPDDIREIAIRGFRPESQPKTDRWEDSDELF